MLQLVGFCFVAGDFVKGDGSGFGFTLGTVNFQGERGNPYRDTDDRPALRACLWEQAQELAGKLARHRLAAGTVQVKVRYGDFTTLTRQLSVEEPLQEAREIYRLGCWLLGREKLVNRPLRLIGLGVSGLREAQAWQLPLVFPA